ncbi:unnamed protein product, partial [Adineta steineri]
MQSDKAIQSYPSTKA